jgi:hypothetical protein
VQRGGVSEDDCGYEGWVVAGGVGGMIRLWPVSDAKPAVGGA